MPMDCEFSYMPRREKIRMHRLQKAERGRSKAAPLKLRTRGRSPTLTKPAHVTLHAPFRVLHLTPAVRTRPNERLSRVMQPKL
jgi:hypothetical protein